MSALTPFLGITEPTDNDPYSRQLLIDNMRLINKLGIIAFAFLDLPWDGCAKGAMVFDTNNKPSSQAITGPNGLVGSMTWSFTSTTITETLSITAPVEFAFSITKTTTLADLSNVSEETT